MLMPSPSPAPAARPHPLQGDAIRFPALVAAVGRMGLEVMRQLRGGLQDRFGTLEALPTLRWICMDSDPDGLKRACEPGLGGPLLPEEVMLVRLNRPSVYLQERTGLGPLAAWINPRML